MDKNFTTDLKGNKVLYALVSFVAAAAVVIVIGICVLHVPVVPMCVLVMLEAGIAVMLHQAELWVHGVLVLAELIAGVLAGRIVLILLCVLLYAAATAVLQILDKD